MDQFDVIIVGGGSAGATLAGRLSEDSSLRILLIEAGRDTVPGAVPDDIKDVFPRSFLNPSYFWPGFSAHRSDGDPSRGFLQARVMGGGSSVMGMMALRGLPSDYDGWEAKGARNWGWRDVYPYFRGMTCDLDQPAPQQNSTGPNLVRRLPREMWPLFMKRIERVMADRGMKSHANIYDTAEDGFFAQPFSHDDERATSARAYLTGAVRARKNLHIVTGTQVLRLSLDSNRVTGVIARRGNDTITYSAKEVAVCAGAINSAALLLRSGIGPAADLRSIGVDPVVDLPGVGQNYQNHPLLHFALTLTPKSRLKQHEQHYTITSLRFSSGLEGCPAGDLFLYFIGRISPRSFGTGMGMIATAIYTPFSRGSVRLVSAEPDVPPEIFQRLLTDPRDRQRMVIVARYAEALIAEPALRDCYEEAYLLPRDPPLKLVNGVGAFGSLKALAASAVLRAPSSVRRSILNRAIRPGRLVAGQRDIRPLSEDEILAATGTMFHPASTCAMGGKDNRMAVTDPECRVYGVDGLRVADASVMPSVPTANTNIPTVMIAERAADFIRCRQRYE